MNRPKDVTTSDVSLYVNFITNKPDTRPI